MSDELYEVAFSGQIKSGADLDKVKANVAAIFKADTAKLAHLFSGKRVIIKKNINQATADKYQVTLGKAGAVCEVRSLSVTPVSESMPPSAGKNKTLPVGASEAPNTDPLGINAESIDDLSAAIAPVGSDIQDDIKQVKALDIDLEGMDMAPTGSDLGQIKKDDDPEPPNTDGLSLVE